VPHRHCDVSNEQARARLFQHTLQIFDTGPYLGDVVPTALFVVNATIGNAKQKKGIRATVYKFAEKYQAYYIGGREPRPFMYDTEGKLLIRTGFVDRSNACAFQTFLGQWSLDVPLLGLGDSVDVQEGLVHQRVEVLDRVLLGHYVPSDEESPMQSLRDLQSSTSHSADQRVGKDSPLFRFQCLEDPSIFSATGTLPYRLHLKPQAKFKALRKMDDNILAGSWAFHQLLDGLNTVDELPALTVAMPSSGDCSWPRERVDGNERHRVTIIVTFRTENQAASVRFKDGSAQLSPTVWQSFVHVQNPELFAECITWKCKETEEKWADAAEPVAALADRLPASTALQSPSM
jgi:hypothetical protein